MNLILWAILGSLACWIASCIIGGQRGWVTNTVIWISGAIFGEVVMLITNSLIGASGFNIYSFAVAVIVIIITLLFMYSYNSTSCKITKKRPQTYREEQTMYRM